MRRTRLLGCLLVALVALGVTARAWGGPFVLDDRSKIVENRDLRSLGDLPDKLVAPYGTPRRIARDDPSRPLVFAIWTVLYHMVGLEPLLYRLVNVLLHALSAVLVFLLLRRLLATMGPRADPPHAEDLAALAGGLFFAVLPIQTGTVIYVYGLSDVLGACLSLAAIVLYSSESATKGRWVGSVACMALALAAKQSAVVIPALLLAVDWVLRPGEKPSSRLRRVAPHLILAVLYVGARFAAFGAIGDIEGAGQREPTGSYVLLQPLVLLRYLQLTVVPIGLSIDHYLPRGAEPAWRLALGIAGIAALLVTALVLARRKTASARLLALGVMLYAIALAPTSSVFPTVDAMVERRVYLGTVGVLLVGTVALRALLARTRVAALVACACLLAAYAGVSLHRGAVFSTRLGLWDDVLAQYPDSPRALNNKATILMARGDYAQADDLLERLVATQEQPIPLANIGRLHEIADSPLHDEAKALAYYDRAIALGEVPAWVHLHAARLHHERRELGLALREYLAALALDPKDAGALNDLGILRAERGEKEEARRCWQEALRIQPGFEAARRNLERLHQAERGG